MGCVWRQLHITFTACGFYSHGMTGKVNAATSVKMFSLSLTACDRETSCHHTELPCGKGKKDQLSLKRLPSKRCLYPGWFGFGASRKQFLRVCAMGGSIASSMSVPGTSVRGALTRSRVMGHMGINLTTFTYVTSPHQNSAMQFC